MYLLVQNRLRRSGALGADHQKKVAAISSLVGGRRIEGYRGESARMSE